MSNCYCKREGRLVAFRQQYFLAIAENIDCLMGASVSPTISIYNKLIYNFKNLLKQMSTFLLNECQNESVTDCLV